MVRALIRTAKPGSARLPRAVRPRVAPLLTEHFANVVLGGILGIGTTETATRVRPWGWWPGRNFRAVLAR